MSTNQNTAALLHQGIAAYHAGQREQAEQLIRQALSAAPNNEQGWLWLAAVVRDLPEVEHALQQALATNPTNKETAAHLAAVRSKLVAQRGEMFKAPTGQRPAINPATLRQTTAANATPVSVAAPTITPPQAAPATNATSTSTYAPPLGTASASTASAVAYVNNYYAPPSSRTAVVPVGPPFALRALYFLFVGWWLTYLWVFAAWAFNLTVIGLPVGLTMLNLVPQVLTLEPVRRNYIAEYTASGRLVTHAITMPQPPLLARAIYFFLIGWWASLGWMMLAATLCLTLIGLPLGIWMFHRSPTITTLRRL